MCLSPITVVNPRYRNLLNHGISLTNYPDDFYLPIPCGVCYDCRKKHSSDWRVRLTLEQLYGDNKVCFFVTLTLSDEYYDRFVDDPSLAIRLFLERIRKVTKRSVKHWFCPELGEKTRRLHFHGFLWNLPYKVHSNLAKFWKYGFIKMSLIKTADIGYATSYTKKGSYYDDGRPFRCRVCCSPGLGRGYLKKFGHFHLSTSKNPLNDKLYINIGNYKYALPRYYRNALFSSERNKLRRSLSGERTTYYVLGRKFSDAFEARCYRESLYRETLRLKLSFPKYCFSNNYINQFLKTSFYVTLPFS